MTATLLVGVLQAGGLPNVWMMEHYPGGTYHGYYIDFNKRTKTVKWAWKFDSRSGSLEGVSPRGEFYKSWHDQAPKQSDKRTFQVYSARKTLLFSVGYPAPYHIGPGKPHVSGWAAGEPMPSASSSGYLKSDNKREVAIHVLDSKRRWHAYPGANMWTNGRNPNEIFVAKVKRNSDPKAVQLERAWLVNKVSGQGNAVTPFDLRELLWPSAKLA